MYVLISNYWYALINSITIRTCAIYRIQITASLSDEDAVYLIKSVVGGLHICKRVGPPTVYEGLQLPRDDTMTVLLRAFRCRYSSSVCQALDHPG